MGDEDDGSFSLFVDADGTGLQAAAAIAASTKFPSHSDIPDKNIFQTKLISKKISADKIVSVMGTRACEPPRCANAGTCAQKTG